ncbi:AAA ATPase [Coemansia sp. RSA 989]|nr:AAA ATPase [Coemansia sp. RSA 1821]KAJ1866334.1 AAA ATPase [Coemansia sp. RSA 989]KAJ1873736.1 AAA ATPase [Coemansia sp. RSA 990]KAJ2632623.1 AAA ATPase [Coemansia sp. RSA 1290]KAJ2653900.1 AAA ATPase [Coemansia sp. RSA 1250]KAJ2677050.1 AAA ATPase [Coemansia sp. RSA 1085]
MPATRSARVPTRRQVLSEAPIKQVNKPAQTLKKTFSVTKHSQPNGKPGKTVSSFVAAKSVLHRSTAAPQIVGRVAEQRTIRKFLQESVEQGRGGSMYISGNPGTGKTACLQSLIKQSEASFPSVLVNCVPLTKPGQVYEAILEALGASCGPDSALSQLEHLVFHSRAFLVILDEVDSLLGSRQEVLYRLFELAAHPQSRMALVGIANALDLTDRFLPRLQARNCEPLLLNFNPYQVKDIVEILQSRLNSVSREPIIQKAALELCARKVAATSGDLRKSLDVCRQAMEMAEAEHRRQAKDKENHDESQPKVTLMHIAKVLTNLNGSPTMQKLEALNFQQKLVLCAHLFLTASDKAKKLGGMAISALFSEYRGICSRLNMMAPVTRSEFLDLVAMMETQGVVAVDASKNGRRGRIVSSSGAADDRTLRLLVDESDARRVLSKAPALAPLF